MLNKIVDINITSIEECDDARLLFLYLYFNNGKNLDLVSKKILSIGNLKYLHYLLRTFKIDEYDEFIDYILDNSKSANYLFDILYDIDYLKDDTRIKLINKIIELKDYRYLIKAVYYYFNILKQYNIDIFNKLKNIIKNELNIEINNDNYLELFEKIIYKEDYEFDYDGYSNNCFKGRNGHIPNIIVCHINNTYGSALKKFYDVKYEVSSHFIIRRDGYIKQVISLDDSAWANGTSLNEESDVYYKFAKSTLINNIKDNANYFTFSIEHESFDGSLTDEQLKSSIKVMKEIIKYLKNKYNYDFIIDREHIIGHNEVNPIVRKKCPGNNFPFDEIINELSKGDINNE